ncbi:MAG: PrsW family glutamic-type intramembrane protease [Chitinophagaceae bacterium]
MWPSLLAISLAPGAAIMLYIYWRDRQDREPIKLLFVCFLLGIVSALLAILIDKGLEPIQTEMTEPGTIPDKLFTAFIMAAFVEELCKFSMCRIYAYPKKAFNEPLDGIVYMVMVAMGFATIENVMYVFSNPETGMQVGLLRMFLAVPGHACWGVIVGYFMGLAKFKPRNKFLYMVIGLICGMLLHGTYDGALFLRESNELRGGEYEGALIGGALFTAVLGYVLAFLAIRKHRKISRALFPKDPNTPVAAGQLEI